MLGVRLNVGLLGDETTAKPVTEKLPSICSVALFSERYPALSSECVVFLLETFRTAVALLNLSAEDGFTLIGTGRTIPELNWRLPRYFLCCGWAMPPFWKLPTGIVRRRIIHNKTYLFE